MSDVRPPPSLRSRDTSRLPGASSLQSKGTLPTANGDLTGFDSSCSSPPRSWLRDPKSPPFHPRFLTRRAPLTPAPPPRPQPGGGPGGPNRLRPSPSTAGHRGHPKHFAPAPHSFPSSLPPALPAPGSRDPAGFAFGRCKGENGNPGMARAPRGQLETVAREQPDPPPRQDGQTHSRRRADRAADPDAAAPIRPLRAAGPARRALGKGARGAWTSSPRPARPTVRAERLRRCRCVSSLAEPCGRRLARCSWRTLWNQNAAAFARGRLCPPHKRGRGARPLSERSGTVVRAAGVRGPASRRKASTAPRTWGAWRQAARCSGHAEGAATPARLIHRPWRKACTVPGYA